MIKHQVDDYPRLAALLSQNPADQRSTLDRLANEGRAAGPRAQKAAQLAGEIVRDLQRT